jgi:Tol biopolymer transport system component/DNA-binding winged helix-turn-helix (wHTH) protein
MFIQSGFAGTSASAKRITRYECGPEMMEINGSDRLRFGAYEADLHTHELWKHGTRIRLVGQPFEILAVLLKHPGQLVTREELRTELWPGDTFVDFNHGLNAAVNKLRDALCDSADDPKFIETLPRRGYRFIATVARDSETRLPAAPLAVGVQPPAAESRANAVPANQSTVAFSPAVVPTPGIPSLNPISSQPRRRRGWFRLAVGAAVVMAGLWLVMTISDILQAYRSERRDQQAAEGGPPNMLAPLTVLSDRTGDPAFSPDGTRVAFRRDSFLPGTSGIWVKQVGGEQLIQLTNSVGDSKPVWSPDGRSLAFSRLRDKQRTIFEVPAAGGEPRALYKTNIVPSHTEIDWSPDGRTITFTAIGKQGTPAIFLLSVDDGRARQITAPPGVDKDWGPAFSPDGNRIVFVRSGNIMVMPEEGGETHRLTEDPVGVLGSPAWAADGRSLVFASASGDPAGLWKIPASGGKPQRIPEAGRTASNPAIAKRGFRLAFELISSARSVDQMDLYPSGLQARTLVTAVSGESAGQQISPDGKKLVFQSDRTGGLDIWVSDRNGQNAIQLTAMGTAGAPRWSPDGHEIAFDVGLGRDWREPRAIYLVRSDGGTPHALIQDRFSNNCPSWSHDGNWVYFPSNRSGDWQVWKIGRSGASPLQVTKQGGFAAVESPDGKYLYYAKHNSDLPEIWRVPVAGGYEAPVFPGVRPLDWAAWTVVDNGILFVEWGVNRVPTVSFYDFSTQGVKHLAELDKPPFWVTASRDGKSVIFDQPEQQESHVVLLENFR